MEKFIEVIRMEQIKETRRFEVFHVERVTFNDGQSLLIGYTLSEEVVLGYTWEEVLKNLLTAR